MVSSWWRAAGASKKTPELVGPAPQYLKVSFEFFNHVLSFQKGAGNEPSVILPTWSLW
jgi:hypothetical protein